MPIEPKQNEIELGQELKSTSDIETRKDKDEQLDPELGVVKLENDGLDQLTGRQTDNLDQEGFQVTVTWKHDDATSQNNLFLSPFQAFRPCQLVAITVYYQVKSSQSGAKLDVRRGNAGSDATIFNNQILLDSTAKVVYTYQGSDFITDKTYMVPGDYLVFQPVNTPTAIRDLCITFHFKYSGRGETRYD